MPYHRARRKNYAVWPPLRMPDEGVFTEDRYLFHHETPLPLKECHIQRLLEYGIQIARGERFSPEEDERIRKNWRSFAREHGFIYEDARYYVGFVDNLETARFQRKQNDILLQMGMWPRLCRKLECRSAAQVQRRIRVIFDPYYVGYPCPLPLETMLRVNELILQGKSKFDIALSLGISMSRLRYTLCRYTRKVEDRGWNMEDVARDPGILTKNWLNRERYRMLFEKVLKKSSLSHTKVAELLQSSPTELKTILRDFNWTALVPSFPPLNAKEIKRAWRNIIKELQAYFLAQLNIFDEYHAWNAAIEQVMPCVRFSLHDVIYYTKSLRKCIDKNTMLVHSQFIDKIRLARRLSAKGIVDGENFDLNVCPIYKRILSFLRTRNALVFRQLRFPLTGREKLRILETCYRRLQSGIDDNVQLTTLPKVSMQLLLECIIDRMQFIDPSWRPPLLFQRWIRSWHYVGMFSKYSSNEEIRNAVVDPHYLRLSLFEDPSSCLYGPHPSSRDLYSHPVDSNEGDSVHGQPSCQVTLLEEEDDLPREKTRHRSTCSPTKTLQVSVGPAPTEFSNEAPETEDLSWHPDEHGRGSTRMNFPGPEYSLSDKTQEESSYDIFADIGNETVLAGNVLTSERSLSDRNPSSPTQSTTHHQSFDPESSPVPSPEKEQFAWENEEDSLKELRISIPARSTISKIPRSNDINGDVLPKEGWMKFLV